MAAGMILCPPWLQEAPQLQTIRYVDPKRCSPKEKAVTHLQCTRHSLRRPGSVGSTCHWPFHSTGHTTSSRRLSEQPARQDTLALLIFLFSSLWGEGAAAAAAVAATARED